MKYLKNEPLSRHTSIKIGGPADIFCIPKNIEELKQVLRFARENRIPISIMGAGTNLLVLDRGFRGIVIKLGLGLNHIEIQNNKARVESGVLLPRLIKQLAGRGFSNLEFLAGVPGTVGGAILMNAGAWGDEIGKYVEQVKVIDDKGEEKIFSKKQLKFGYRKSIFQNGHYIIVEVIFKLRKKSNKIIKNKINEYMAKRKETQPLGTPNCGCIFKNPPGNFAGKLIQDAECKGLRYGDAQISNKHANFILNLGEASAKDVIRLMTRAQKTVKNKYKIRLEPEIKIMVKST